LDRYREWKKTGIPTRVLYNNLESSRPRGRPRNRWQDEVRGGWKNSWWRRVTGKSIQQRGIEEAPENSMESLNSACANRMN
jgi:hypothetical protein